ncbi:unnamed protein product [Laminaria digitata]
MFYWLEHATNGMHQAALPFISVLAMRQCLAQRAQRHLKTKRVTRPDVSCFSRCSWGLTSEARRYIQRLPYRGRIILLAPPPRYF